MVPRPRSTRSSAARGAAGKLSQRQSSLTFNNSRVTKPLATVSAKDKKTAAEAEVKAAKLLEETAEQSPVQDEIEEVTPDDEVEKISKEIPIRSQTQEKVAQGPEAAAEKISETQIRKYWKGKEAERKTPRVHQDGLSLHEKVLREFDMSYQYGPCIGITRKRRWTRAEKLGLRPPIEVLAVLLKEDTTQKDKKHERAYMDTLANAKLGVIA